MLDAPQTSLCLIASIGAMEEIRRKLVWAERENFGGWACSECLWVYNPQGPLIGESLDEMKSFYEKQRDQEFARHVCAEHQKL